MDKRDLQKKLSQPYTTANWQEVVQFVFPNVQILNPPVVIPIDNDKVESFRQLGNVQLHDGKSLALFELKLKENVNIIRNRVELNNIVSQYIDQDQTHGVLSIFEKGGDDYRFTFSASASEFDEEEGDFVTKKTDTKRFTYVLGKNESCKTPAQRFYELSEKKNSAEIDDIQNAFSVEKLSKSFFKEYKEQYTSFVNYMMQTPGIFKAIYSEDDKAIRDFVKILLGRIIFIKFVQKKGWMGVDAASSKWIDGDYRFMEQSFQDFKHQELFYSSFLEPLFETLNQPNRPNDIFTVTNSKVPYLSGGLFELEDKKTKNINFPASFFESLFDFLDRYNFTIDENDTNDHEVGIDPEMLGHIFENLLEDNKDKGAFYTPKEIVRYMCQESLKEYLKTSLENNKQWPTDENEAKGFEQALHNFVTKKEAGGIIEFEETIARALKEVKICDPAIGSGAFPMGLLNEIFQLVHKLHEANKDKVERVWELKGWQPNLVKQNIIQNSIYGVDIEKGAVDVARLRFWLSLIVDEPEPKALPHLDYKIVVGNSLVSKLDDTIIDIDWEVQNDNNLPETDLFGKPKPKQFNAFEVENDEKQKQLLKEISAKQKLVFDPNSNEEKLSLEIRNLKIDLLVNQLDAMVKTKGVTTKPTETGKKLKAQTELWLQTLGWQQQIEKLKKLRKDPNGILHFFDWRLDFPEIMNEQVTDKVGFDIVIANPPYIDSETMVNTGNESLRIYLSKKLRYCRGNWDIYIAFFEFSYNLLNTRGNLVFITPDKWISKPFGYELRKGLVNNFRSIAEAGRKVFENAKVDSIITFINKYKNKNIIIDKFSNSKINNLSIVEISNLKEPYSLDWLFSEHVNFIARIDKFENKLSDFGVCENACATSDAYKLKDYIHDNFDSNFDSKKQLKIINTGTIGRYVDKWGLREMTYLKDKYLFPVIQKEIFKRDFSNSYGEKSLRPKIIIKGLTLLDCSFDKNGEVIPGKSTMIITKNTGKENELLFPLALLNSKIPLFYIKQKYRGSSYNQGINFSTDMINDIPIPPISDKSLKKINDSIFNVIKNLSNDISISDIDNNLNELFYKLYELTYDEVLVVEPEFAERMSREAYGALQVE